MNLAYTHSGQEIFLTLESGNIFWNPCTPIHYKNFMISKLIFVCVCVPGIVRRRNSCTVVPPASSGGDSSTSSRRCSPSSGPPSAWSVLQTSSSPASRYPGHSFFLRFKAYILIFLKRFIKKIGYSIGLSSITEVDQHIYRTLKIISIIDMYMCTYV